MELAKEFSTNIWNDPAENWHKDYILEKVNKMNNVDTKQTDNIWFFINQFDFTRILKLWHLAKHYNTKRATELALFVEKEYLEKLQKETGLKVLVI